MKLLLDEAPSELRQGWPTLLSIRVENLGKHILLPEQLSSDAPLGGTMSWRPRPPGALLFDAMRDRYRLHATRNTQAAIPLCTAVLAPGDSVETLLTVKLLEPGTHQVRLQLSAQELPLEEAPRRLYQSRSKGSLVTYLPLGDEELLPGAPAIARLGGRETLHAELVVELQVAADEGAPLEAALAQVPGGTPVERWRSARGAWVIQDPQGSLHLVHGEERLGCPPETLDLALIRERDLRSPFEPCPIHFAGAGAEALRDGGELPLQGTPPRQVLAPEGLWDLVAAAAARGLRLRWGRVSTVERGFVVRA